MNFMGKKSVADNSEPKDTFIRKLKFYLIPFYRKSEFSKREYEIGKIKSKRKAFARFLNPLTIIGVLCILYILLLAVFPQWLTTYTIEEVTRSVYYCQFQPPGLCPEDQLLHIMGSTKSGIDIHARLVWGGRSALTLGLFSQIVSVSGGVILGITAAYFGGRTDAILLRVFDIVMSFPQLIIALLFVQMFGQNIQVILLVYGVLGIPYYARFIRAKAYEVKQYTFIQAAKTSGEHDFRIMFSEIMPNSITPVLISFSYNIGSAILGIATLSFIGLGDENVADWGTDINWGYERILSQPWISVWPGLMIAICVLGFMLIGDGVRDALDPKFQVTQ
jgi:peptide/nickel transport system permease protein